MWRGASKDLDGLARAVDAVKDALADVKELKPIVPSGLISLSLTLRVSYAASRPPL